MSEVFVLMLVGALVLFRVVAKTTSQKSALNSDAAPRARQRKPEKPSVPIPDVSRQKRAQMEQRERFRAAKAQQDDAERLHAVHVDSCESKLESLRVLHEAGILDNVEYAERVARTKARHARSGKG